jgi:ribosomal protein S18 acetylase RimI-like enzyme
MQNFPHDLNAPEFANLIRLQPNLIKTASLIFADAFHNNPLFKILIPDEAERENKLHFLFEYLVTYGVKCGVVLCANKDLEGMAILISESNVNESFFDQLRCGGLKILYQFGRNFLTKQAELGKLVKRCHQNSLEKIGQRHIYLSSLCVHPSKQGNGLAGILLNSLITYSNHQKIPLYLETAKEANLPLYEHFGFKIVDSIKIPRTDYIIFGMAYIPC